MFYISVTKAVFITVYILYVTVMSICTYAYKLKLRLKAVRFVGSVCVYSVSLMANLSVSELSIWLLVDIVG